MEACQTWEARSVWNVTVACERQMRVGMNGPYAWDIAAVLLAGQALEADLGLLLELAPELEALLLFAWRPSE